jgi:ribose transport system substrate-binding protein
MAAEEMIKKLKKAGVSESTEGVICVQIGSAGSQTILDRCEGFKTYWNANAPANWKVLWDDMKVNDGDITKAVGFGQDFLTTYSNLIGFFTPNNGSTVGAVTALMEADRTDVTMVGFDFSKEMEELIRSGKYNVSTMLQRQYFMGYDGVAMALNLANGGTAAEKIVDTGIMAVDSDNVDSPEVLAVRQP